MGYHIHARRTILAATLSSRLSKCLVRHLAIGARQVVVHHKIADDDAYLDTIDASLDIGTIQLQLWRFQVQNVVTRPLEHSYGGPVLEEQVVHERSKKAGAHHVKYVSSHHLKSPLTLDQIWRGISLTSSDCRYRKRVHDGYDSIYHFHLQV